MGAIQNYVIEQLDAMMNAAREVEQFADLTAYDFNRLSTEHLATVADSAERIRKAIQNLAAL